MASVVRREVPSGSDVVAFLRGEAGYVNVVAVKGRVRNPTISRINGNNEEFMGLYSIILLGGVPRLSRHGSGRVLPITVMLAAQGGHALITGDAKKLIAEGPVLLLLTQYSDALYELLGD